MIIKFEKRHAEAREWLDNHCALCGVVVSPIRREEIGHDPTINSVFTNVDAITYRLPKYTGMINLDVLEDLDTNKATSLKYTYCEDCVNHDFSDTWRIRLMERFLELLA